MRIHRATDVLISKTYLLIIHVKSNSTITNGKFKTDFRNREGHHICNVTTQAYISYTEQHKLTNHHRPEWIEFTTTRQACLHDCKSRVKRQKVKGNIINVRRKLHRI